MSDCQLAELPAAVCGLTALRELSLAGNQLAALPPGITALKDSLRKCV
jgi:Leucine-rich repeat (LRR) protein